MNRRLRQLKQAIAQTRLKDSERDDMREHIKVFMAIHPVRNADDSRQVVQTGLGKHFPALSVLLTRKPMMATVAIMLIMMLGSGVAYAAEGSIPGEPLYSVKIHVNENVRAALATTAEADAALDAHLAERRLEEAATLAASGQLDAGKSAQLEKRFTAHVQKMEAEIVHLEEAGKTDQAVELTNRLEASLAAHERVLAVFDDAKDANVIVEVKPLLKKIRQEVKASAVVRAKAEERIAAEGKEDVKQSAQVRMEQAGEKLDAVMRLMVQADVSEEVKAKTEAQIIDAKNVLAEAKTLFEVEQYGQALTLFSRAGRIAEEAKVFAERQAELRLGLPAAARPEVRREQEKRRNDEVNKETEPDATSTSDQESGKRIELIMQNELRARAEAQPVEVRSEEKIENSVRDSDNDREQEVRGQNELEADIRL